MKAVLIAGGFGTRLRPLTYTRPKHLLPIANLPHLHHVFDLLQRHDIDELVLLTSYMAETFEASIAEARSRGMEVTVAHEEEPLDTAGAIKNAEDLIGDGTFFAFNGDILTDMDLTAMLELHRRNGAVASIALTPVEDPSAYGVVPTDPDGRVLGFIEKPPREEAPTNLINAGVYIFEAAVLDRIPAGEPYSAERGLFPSLVAEGAGLYAAGTDAYWMDVGTPEKYLAANLDALSGRFATGAVPSPGPEASAIAGDVDLDPGSTVSTSCLGSGCSLEQGAAVTRSVLLPGVAVSSGAEVIDCVLGEDVVIEAGVSVRGATVGDGEKISTND